jgi:hypothetical protein
MTELDEVSKEDLCSDMGEFSACGLFSGVDVFCKDCILDKINSLGGDTTDSQWPPIRPLINLLEILEDEDQ